MAFANTVEYAKLFQTELDEVAVQESVTGWMDANAGAVIYDGGSEIKIPQMALDGLADYSRASGYVDGDIDFSYQTHTIANDRGRRFQLDAMDVNETNFVMNAGAVLANFQREYVIPEVDAVRIAGLAEASQLEATLPADATPEEAFATFKQGILQVRDAGYAGQLVAHVTYAFKGLLESHLNLQSDTFSINGIDTQLPSIDGVGLIATTSDRMHTEVTLSSDGFTPAGEEIPFLIAPLDSAVGVNKQDVPRIFTPDENQHADAWIVTYRRYYDVIVPDNKAKLVLLGKKEA